MKRIALIAVASALVLALAAPVALAGTVRVNSTISLELSPPNFTGKVSTPDRSACASNRTVRVYSEDAAGSHLLGSTTSAKRGRWTLAIPASTPGTGSFYATVSRSKRGELTCKVARSDSSNAG